MKVKYHDMSREEKDSFDKFAKTLDGMSVEDMKKNCDQFLRNRELSVQVSKDEIKVIGNCRDI